jgi:hypothetical protein
MRGTDKRFVRAWLLCAMVAGVAGICEAQIYQIRSMDVGAAIASGDARVTVAPPTTADSTKPFDGNPFTEMALLTSDSVSLTLEFKNPVTIEKSKVFFWNPGVWTLEAADTLTDLNAHSGSYALLTENNSLPSFAWDSVSFTKHSVRCVRLRAVSSTAGSGIYVGEWSLLGTVTFTNFVFLPSPLRVVAGTSLQMRVNIQDDQGRIYPNFLTEPLDWGSEDHAIATVDPYGKVTGHAIGSTTVTVKTDARTLMGSAPISVVADFRGEKVPPMTIKVAVVYQDPTLPNSNRLHEEFASWRDPRLLVPCLIKHFRQATDSVLNFQIVESIEGDRLFTKLHGSYLTITQYYQLLKEPNWVTLKAEHDSSHLEFDYKEFVKFYNFDTKRNNGTIDEVWVFAAPYLEMAESQLMGPNAFWWNSSPIKTGTALTKNLSVMGLNYERGVDQAFHSFGHRVESAMWHAYMEAQGRDWDTKSTNPTPWDLFTRIEKDTPGLSHVGNVHFPPNGSHDYDYGNSTLVTSYAENWYRYPYLFDQTSQVNVQTWYYTPGEPLAEGNDHLGYLRWWYGHLPRYKGVTDGVLNNWWRYATDYESAVAEANVLSAIKEGKPAAAPQGYLLDQNYPNPFNPATHIGYRVQGSGERVVRLAVYDLLGREVAVLVNENKQPGYYVVQFDSSGLSSGVYFYRLKTGDLFETKKMVVMK